MNTKSLKSLALVVATAALAGLVPSVTGCSGAEGGGAEPTSTGSVSEALSPEGTPTAMERMKRLGLTDMRGIAYDPGPAADANGKYGFTPSDFVEVPEHTERKYTIYNDSDFANADFSSLWGKGPDGNGRDDLRRFKEELNVNFVTLYDWNAGSDAIPQMRDHQAFFNYADSLGIKVTASVSDWIRREQLCSSDAARRAEGYRGVERIAAEIYPDGKPLGGAGMIKIFNEPENQSACPQWASLVAESIATIQAQENALGVAEADRLPIFVPTTFGITNGIPGGVMSDIHDKIVAHPKLGEGFWKSRMVIAVNPFNEGFFMKTWLETTLPKFETAHGIPTDTPVIFTEYGKSSGELGNDVNKQAAWVDEQFQAMKKHPTPSFLGTVAFVNQVRPWLSGTEVGFGLLEFDGNGGSWSYPSENYLAKVTYKNPNGGGNKWDGAYPVQRQTPRPAYGKVADAYKR